MHTKTDTKHWHVFFTRIADCFNFTFCPTLTKSTWDNDTISITKHFFNIVSRKIIGINPFKINSHIINIT